MEDWESWITFPKSQSYGGTDFSLLNFKVKLCSLWHLNLSVVSGGNHGKEALGSDLVWRVFRIAELWGRNESEESQSGRLEKSAQPPNWGALNWDSVGGKGPKGEKEKWVQKSNKYNNSVSVCNSELLLCVSWSMSVGWTRLSKS